MTCSNWLLEANTILLCAVIETLHYFIHSPTNIAFPSIINTKIYLLASLILSKTIKYLQIKMHKYYDIETRDERAEVGFFVFIGALALLFICVIWILFPDSFQFLPSLYWFGAIPTLLFSAIFWVPLFIAICNCAFY